MNLIESDKMNDIEEKYFGKNEMEQVRAGQLSTDSTSLTFHSFGGLFLITVISIILALVVSETDILVSSETGIWQRPILMAIAYSQRFLLRTSPSTDTPVHPTLDSTQGMETV